MDKNEGKLIKEVDGYQIIRSEKDGVITVDVVKKETHKKSQSTNS